MKKIVTLISAVAIIGVSAFFTACESKPAVEEKVADAPKTEEPKTESAPVAAELLVDDFEEGMFWEAIGTSWNDGDVSIACDLSTEWGSDDSTSIKCTVGTKGGEWEKGGFFTTPYEMDWTGMTKLCLEVYNPNEFDISICPVLQCGEGWEDWNQFTEQPVPAGETATLEYEIPHKQYLNFVQRVIIYSFGPLPAEATFYMDNIYAKN